MWKSKRRLLWVASILGVCLISGRAQTTPHDVKPGDLRGKPGTVISAAPIASAGSG